MSKEDPDVSKEDLQEEQYLDILTRATMEAGINPGFLVDHAISYGGIGITASPTRSNPRSSTPAGFGLGSSPEQFPIGQEEQEFYDWVRDWPNTADLSSATPVRRSSTPAHRSGSISPIFTSSSTLPAPPPRRSPPVRRSTGASLTRSNGRGRVIRRGVNVRYRGGRGKTMPRGKRLPLAGGGGGGGDDDDDDDGGDDDRRRENILRELQRIQQNNIQRARGRHVAGVTHTNTITTTYKDGGRPTVNRSSNTFSP